MTEPSRRAFLRTAAAGTAAALAGCPTPPPAEDPGFTEGFEDGIGEWERAGHVGPDAFDEFEWSIDVSDERARSGDQSLAVFTEGRHDDGTAWVARRVSVPTGASYRARGSAYFYAEQESFNTLRHAVLYLAPTAPEAEDDFPPPNRNSTTDDTGVGGLREPLQRAAGWEEYAFEYETGPVETGELYFAVGTSVVWETDRSDFVDDVALTLETGRRERREFLTALRSRGDS